MKYFAPPGVPGEAHEVPAGDQSLDGDGVAPRVKYLGVSADERNATIAMSAHTATGATPA